MKRLKVMLGVFIFSFFWSDSFAQGYVTEVGATVIDPRPIKVSFTKTTNLVFPQEIEEVDYGSNAIIVQQRKKAKNILHIKAAKKGFEQTSLSVSTKGGGFYSFVVDYTDSLQHLSYVFEEENHGFTITSYPVDELELQSRIIANMRPSLRQRAFADYAALELHGSYISKDALWLKFRFINCSTVDFPISFVKLIIRDKKQSKRKAIQETEIYPVYSRLPENVSGRSCELLIFALKPFVIPKQKRLLIQIGDKNGSRFIQLKVKNKHIALSRPVK